MAKRTNAVNTNQPHTAALPTGERLMSLREGAQRATLSRSAFWCRIQNDPQLRHAIVPLGNRRKAVIESRFVEWLGSLSTEDR